MSKAQKLADYMRHPQKIVIKLAGEGYLPIISDEQYLKMQFKQLMGYPLNLDDPKTLNEKLQWLKLHDRRPEYTTMVDKVAAKKWVADRIGQEHIIPTLGVWDDPDEIDFDALPDQFVLKCNHNSGLGMCICRDKAKLDIPKVKSELRRGLRQNYYLRNREWPYKDVPRKVIAEEYLHQQSGKPIADYKFYCYGGKAQYFMYSLGEAEHNVRNHKFDMQLQSIDYLFKRIPKIDVKDITLPSNMERMINIVNVLCEGTQHLRVDLYSIDDHIYFGELTFYSGGGYINILSSDYSQYLADRIDIQLLKEENR